MWDAAHDAIADATELFVFGFSFPTCDTEVCGLFRKAIEFGRRLRYAAIIDVAPEPVGSRFGELLPPGLDVKLEGFVVPTDFEWPGWWAKPGVKKQSSEEAAGVSLS